MECVLFRDEHLPLETAYLLVFLLAIVLMPLGSSKKVSMAVNTKNVLPALMPMLPGTLNLVALDKYILLKITLTVIHTMLYISLLVINATCSM